MISLRAPHLLFACVLACLLAPRAAAAEELAQFEGVWLGEGYSCVTDGAELLPSSDYVYISVEGEALIAVKLDYPPCPGLGAQARRAGVPGGQVTWRVEIPNGAVVYGRPYAAQSRVASPDGQQSWVPGELVIKGPDEIQWRTPSAATRKLIIFRRGSAPVS